MAQDIISTRYIIQRRWPKTTKGASYAAMQWHDSDWQPDGRVNHFPPAIFKTLDEAKKALKKLTKFHPHREFRIVKSERTLVEL